MKTMSLAATTVAILGISVSVSADEEYRPLTVTHGVEIAWQNRRHSDGSGGYYYIQVLRFSNRNSVAVDISYEARLTCADGSHYDRWQGADTLRPGATKGGELSGHWSRGCDGHGDGGYATAISIRGDVTPR